MKRIIHLLLFFLAFLANDLAAQQKRDSTRTAAGAERVQALKVAFITDRLALTPAEAEKFWPIYNEYQDKRDVIRKQLQEDYRKIREQSGQLSDEELTRLSDEIISLRQQDVALQAEMNEKLKTVLPAKKLALLYVAEEEFKKKLVEIITQDNQKPPKPKER